MISEFNVVHGLVHVCEAYRFIASPVIARWGILIRPRVGDFWVAAGGLIPIELAQVMRELQA
jgi:hypothetical protein